VKADVVFTVGPSVAVTVMGYDPGTVVGVIVTVADAVLVESAWEVAVMVALAGRPSAAVGAV
jgi:transcriptional accessory protein Tex/SPT6